MDIVQTRFVDIGYLHYQITRIIKCFIGWYSQTWSATENFSTLILFLGYTRLPRLVVSNITKKWKQKNCHLRWLSLVQCSQLWVLHLSDILEPVIPTCKLSSSYENITIMVMYFRYVPNQMAPLTIVLSFILAIAANLPRFFELQVMNMFFILMRLSYISNDDVTHLLSR